MIEDIEAHLAPIEVSVEINGRAHKMAVPAHRTLLDALRDDLCLTGTKKCCADGECGACTVFMDGKTVNSCLVLAVEVEGSSVTTIEGLSCNGPTDLQEEFVSNGAVQCGVCIPGQVMAAEALLQSNLNADEIEIRDVMSGNLCRCAGYQRIVAAIQATAARRGATA